MKKQKSKRWLLFILAGIAAIAAALHIYAVFTVLGICLTLVFLTFLHVNPLILIWGTFFLFSLIIIVLIA